MQHYWNAVWRYACSFYFWSINKLIVIIVMSISSSLVTLKVFFKKSSCCLRCPLFTSTVKYNLFPVKIRIFPFCNSVKVLISFYWIYDCVLCFHSRQAPVHQFYGMKSSGENFVGFKIHNISVTDIQRMNKWRQDWLIVLSWFIVRCVICCGVCLKGPDSCLEWRCLWFRYVHIYISL